MGIPRDAAASPRPNPPCSTLSNDPWLMAHLCTFQWRRRSRGITTKASMGLMGSREVRWRKNPTDVW